MLKWDITDTNISREDIIGIVAEVADIIQQRDAISLHVYTAPTTAWKYGCCVDFGIII